MSTVSAQAHSQMPRHRLWRMPEV